MLGDWKNVGFRRSWKKPFRKPLDLFGIKCREELEKAKAVFHLLASAIVARLLRLAVIDDKLAALLPPGALSSAGLSPEALTGTPEQIQALPPDILLPVTQAMADSITAIFLCTVPLLAIGVAIAIVVPELPLKDTAHIGSTLEGAEITVAEIAGGEAAVDELTSHETVAIDADGVPR